MSELYLAGEEVTMFTLRQLIGEVKPVCATPINHVREMRTYAKDNPTDTGFCRWVLCSGCNIPAQARLWSGAKEVIA